MTEKYTVVDRPGDEPKGQPRGADSKGDLLMADRPRPQELYRHFKGNLYQIITIAINTETKEEMVVYQALYGDYRTYVRPLDMFMSEVNRKKYPDAVQRYRFEKVKRSSLPDTRTVTRPDSGIYSDMDRMGFEGDEKVVRPARVSHPGAGIRNTGPVRLKFDKKPFEKTGVMSKSIDDEARDLNLDPLVIQFMDADLASEKSDILVKLKPIITNEMIDIMALSVGVVVNEGDVYDRYNDLRTCLATMEKFESSRLRS